MIWNLFIDDERNPIDVKWAPYYIYDKYLSEEWTIARNEFEVYYEIAKRNQFPAYISFDHDLGKGEATGYDIVKELVSRDMDNLVHIPPDFQFYVHSKNPIGAKNIQMYLDNYLKLKNGINK